MKCAVIGGVQSTAVLIYALHQHGFKNVRVWGFEPKNSINVSGWADLKKVSLEVGYDYCGFQKVIECQESLAEFEPDVLFVVGLSQLIPKPMLEIARLLNVGFHPTALPKGRGRAAIAWLVINQCDGAATFFELQEGMDDGAILVQEPFMVKPADYAYDVEQKILLAEKNALDRWLPRIKENKIERHEQEHQKASWYGRRTPEDGWINWTIPAEDILKLIRASAAPHPGAYTFSGEHRIIIWKASRAVRDELGVVGRILSVQEDYSFVVQTGSGLVTVEEWDADAAWRPKVGMKLGFYLELENFQLKEQVKELRARLDALEKEIFNAS